MTLFINCVIFILIASAWSSPVSVEKEENKAEFEDDPIGYVHDTIADFIDSIFNQDHFQVSKDVNVERNNVKIEKTDERSINYEEKIEKYIKTHDVRFNIPLIGQVKIENKNLDNDEIGLNIKFGENNVEEARKSKLKKILTPILVFVLLKAITVVPLVIGALLLKAWSSLQLSIFSFVISSGLAIFQLCRKIAENNAQAQISAHGPWEAQALAKQGRSLNKEDMKEAQNLAYSASRK